jgi:methyl-accepting chemotaxis protein
VTDWQVVFLGVMAFALVAMAVAQLVAAMSLMRAVRQVSQTVEELRRDVRPVLDKANRIAEDASRVAALAVDQAERVDHLLRTTSDRIDETFATLQRAFVQPVRQGSAIIAALRAGFEAMRSWQGRPAHRREDEDPLFVG